ncbi:MAG TPA: GlsB/YeaQ/YmgE family stress response membrane protein [Roseiflexaceae bacterium]|nr:GlsB/YeaQ/YmgE family stress response membrane protein [Roseiflexaceae bacterium]
MGLVDFLLLILVGAICGAVAEMIVGFSPGGFLASVAIGFVGALIGTWLARQLDLPSIFALTIGGYTIEIVWAILGAVILLLILSLTRRRTYYRRRRYY